MNLASAGCLTAPKFRDRISAAETIQVKGLEFTKAQVEHEDFSDNEGECIAHQLKSEIYYHRYERENRVRDMSENARIAEAMFDAHQRGDDTQAAAFAAFSAGYSDWGYLQHELCKPEVHGLLSDLIEQAEELGWEPAFEIDEVEDEISDILREAVEDADKSTPLDALGSYDRVQIAFLFHDPKGYASDYMVQSHRSWADWQELSISQGLLHALPRLGYTLGDYRKHSGNKHERNDDYPMIPKRQPLASLDQLQVLVDNACSSYFHFAIYAQVPLASLIRMDLRRPIRLDRYALSTINCNSGTFMDVTIDKPVILRPEDGVLRTFTDEGPHGWCGLSGNHYHAEISQ